MEFHFVFWKKQNLIKSSILSKVSFYPEKLSRLSEKFNFPNFPKVCIIFLVFDGFPSDFDHFLTTYSNLKSSILQISKVFWSKVPFYQKFHFIPKNLVRFWDPKVPFYRGSILPWDLCNYLNWMNTITCTESVLSSWNHCCKIKSAQPRRPDPGLRVRQTGQV